VSVLDRRGPQSSLAEIVVLNKTVTSSAQWINVSSERLWACCVVPLIAALSQLRANRVRVRFEHLPRASQLAPEEDLVTKASSSTIPCRTSNS
jgi:hypothetical protein